MKQNVLITVSVIFGITYVGCHDADRYHYIQPGFGKYGKQGYYFQTVRVGWTEAYSICLANNSKLAEVDNEEKARFIGDYLAEHRHEMEDYWIGSLQNDSRWRWVSSKVEIPMTPPDGAKETAFPRWVVKKSENAEGEKERSKERKCLAIDRESHALPIFVPLPCHLPRHFICEKEVPEEGEGDEIPPVFFSEGNKKYIFYHKRMNFHKAVMLCSKLHTSLATVDGEGLAKKLQRRMYKARPEFDRVWIGGRVDNGKFKWMATGKDIPVGRDQFPFWLVNIDNGTRKGKECLLLDSHKRPHFQDEDCNRERFVLCEEESARLNKETRAFPVERKTFNGNTYTFVAGEATHAGAINYCKNKENGELLRLNGKDNGVNPELWHWILNAMSELKIELFHVWLDAVSDETRWMWGKDSGNLPCCVATDSGFPKWADLEVPKGKCLNLDRFNHNDGVLYGLGCGLEQNFICMRQGGVRASGSVKTEGGDESQDLQSDVQAVEYAGRNYEIHYQRENFEDAMNACARLPSSSLATFRELGELKHIISQQTRLDGVIWVGANYKDSAWSWISGEPFPKIEHGYPPLAYNPPRGNNTCLTLEISSQETPKLVDRSCNDKQFYVCEVAPPLNDYVEMEEGTSKPSTTNPTTTTRPAVRKHNG